MFAVLAFFAKEMVAVLLQGHAYNLRSRFEQKVSLYMAVVSILAKSFLQQ
jgi:hypothetical protein